MWNVLRTKFARNCMELINTASKRTNMLKDELRETKHLEVRRCLSSFGVETKLKVLFNSGCHCEFARREVMSETMEKVECGKYVNASVVMQLEREYVHG